jgi:hypothetical protein
VKVLRAVDEPPNGAKVYLEQGDKVKLHGKGKPYRVTVIRDLPEEGIILIGAVQNTTFQFFRLIDLEKA